MRDKATKINGRCATGAGAIRFFTTEKQVEKREPVEAQWRNETDLDNLSRQLPTLVKASCITTTLRL